MDKKYILLVFAIMIVAFSLSFSISATSTKKDLTGQAYAYNQGVCSYCREYCGQTYPNSAGTIVSTSDNLHVKALGKGCTGNLEWAENDLDVVLCCR